MSSQQWFLIAAIAIFAAPAEASFADGAELLTKCTAASSQDRYCAGYLSGIADAVPGTDYRNTIRLTPSVTLGQIRDVVVNFLEEKPELRHYQAASIVLTSPAEGFPC